jgi:hypothetical protein
VDDSPPPRPRSLVDAVLDASTGREGAAVSGLSALLLVTALGPVGGAAWLATVRQDCARFLQREVRLSAVFVPVASFLSLGLVGAVWRAVVLAPLVEEVQARAGLARTSVSRGRYALPLLHALFVQEDLTTAWLAARAPRRD